jgi:hypothetical protein
VLEQLQGSILGVPVWLLIAAGVVLLGFTLGWWSWLWAKIVAWRGGTVVSTTIDAKVTALILAIGGTTDSALAKVLKASLSANGDAASAALCDPLIASIEAHKGATT